jgi:hypothetical protein
MFGVDLGSGDGLIPLARADYAAKESLDAAGQIRAITFTLHDSTGSRCARLPGAARRIRARSRGRDGGRRPESRLTDYSLTARARGRS